MLFVSTSGPLGRYISLSPPLSIWYRSLIALGVLTIYCSIKKYSFKLSWNKHGVALLLSGLFMGLHWVTYFYALQWSSITIGMLSLFTYPILTVFLEPLFLPVKLQRIHLLFGLMILLGIYFLVPVFDMGNKATQGLLMGIFSSVTYALRNLLLKAHSDMAHGSMQMLYQMVIIIVFLFPVLWLFPDENISSNLPYLFLLGIATTAIGHTLFLSSFPHFSISTVSIMSSVQPLFGVVLGMLFLGEIPTIKSVFGGALIILTVVLESKRIQRNSKLMNTLSLKQKKNGNSH
jgi:drug/metabolite transporter (DMT)-like permease